MAKKNLVHLMGIVEKVLCPDPLIFMVKTEKSFQHYSYPIVTLDENANPAIMEGEIKEGRVVVINGRLRTEREENTFECPCCGKPIQNSYLNTFVTADNIRVVGRMKGDRNLFMNRCVLLGALCREINFRYINGSVHDNQQLPAIGNAKFQMAVNRRIPNETDYPYVSSYARQAEEDYKRIDIGSQVLVDGVLVTRANTKIATCPECGEEIEITETLTEVSAQTVEYLNNCYFEEVGKKNNPNIIEDSKPAIE